MQIDMRPVVQSRTFEIPVGKRKTEGFDKVQTEAQSGTKPRDVAGIGGNLRFNKNNVDHAIM